MPEQIKIASLAIDLDDVIKESVRLQKEIDKTKEAQSELDRTTEEGTAQYLKYDAQLKNTKKALRDNQNLVSALDSANSDLNKTLEVENKKTQELYDSRRELQQIAKNIQGNTEEEIALRNKLNTAIDAQTEKIRDQSSSFNAGKDSIGEYENGIVNAYGALGGFGQAMQKGNEFVEKFQRLGSHKTFAKNEEAIEGTNKGLKGYTKGMLGAIKQSAALIATPIGIVLAAIAGAFVLVKNAMDRSEDSTAKIKTAFAGFSGILKFFQKLIEPVGNFLINVFAKGLEKIADLFGKLNPELQKTIDANRDLAKAQLEYDKAARETEKTQLRYQKRAEELRQIRDDETKSIKERKQANEDLGAVLNEQLQNEKDLAQKALDLARLRLRLDGYTKENLDAEAEAETKILEIEERITGQRSEQLVNRVALDKEAQEKIDKERQAKADAEKQRIAEELEASKKLAEEKIAIARYELNEYIKANQSKLDNEKYLTQQMADEEKARFDLIAQQKREFEAKRLESGLINQLEYNTAINQINDENEAKKAEIQNERNEAEKVKQAIDAENYFTYLEEKGAHELVLQNEQLAAQYMADLESAKKTGADLEMINKIHIERQKKINAEYSKQRLTEAENVFGNLKNLFGENTIAGKAAGIAQATVNTYLGATEVLAAPSVLPEPIATITKIANVAAVIGSGLQSVSKISGVSTQFSKGDILRGASHDRGGIPFSVGGKLGFEAEGGEAIINKRSTAMFAPLLSAINVAGGGKKFANGGIAGATSAPSMLFDYDMMAEKISEANAALPAPRVGIDEITETADQINVVENLANL